MTPLDKHGIFIHSSVFYPQEELLSLNLENNNYKIGIPVETNENEYRVPLAPLAVEQLINEGFEVLVESAAGKGARFTDLQYAECGAIITFQKEEIFKCDIILKISPLTIDEIELLTRSQIIISSLSNKIFDRDYFLKLMQKRVTTIAINSIKEIVHSMDEIVGKSSILIASEYLNNIHNGKGEMLGGLLGVSPTEIVIIGAGTAGVNAATTACALGANLKVFDNSLHNLNNLQKSLGRKIFTSTIHKKVLASAIKTADVLVGAVRSDHGYSELVVTEEMVKSMKENSIIIDTCIDQGGIIETARHTTHKNPIFKKHGVIHYCVPNIASRVARTASYSISNSLLQILLKLNKCGTLNQFLRANPEFCEGVYIFNGILTNRHIGVANKINAKDINLLLAAM
ncbi:alanine dehydrogenase [Bacteroidales bacterium OttesenSCG-928-I21]|nr:alanine dehydrogenase [Bacteroidales bacterium OttesenSCG-928-I21]